MPNGDPNFHVTELPTLEAFFGRIADDLTAFATEHGLRIERYYHQLPSWEFCVDHPVGGSAYMELRRVDDATFRIHSAWWVDDRGARKRYSRFATSPDHSVARSDISRLLREAYDTVRAWKPGQWTLVSDL